jgi:hypothetical protein
MLFSAASFFLTSTACDLQADLSRLLDLERRRREDERDFRRRRASRLRERDLVKRDNADFSNMQDPDCISVKFGET